MRGLLLFTTIYLVSKLALSAELCPAAEEIFPCKCENRQGVSIECVGPGVKDLKRIFGSKLKSDTGAIRQFQVVYINHTSITEIEAKTFGDASFHAIFIVNNHDLKRIDANSFRKADTNSSHLGLLDIINNTNLVSSREIFQLATNLQVRDKMELSNLGITEIPDNAFSMNLNLWTLLIRDNPNLTRIGKSAFTPLQHLKLLLMNNNSISTIDDSGLEFEANNLLDSIVVLEHNKITDEGLSNNLFGNKTITFPQSLILNNNKIKKLRPQIFRHKFGNDKIQHLEMFGNPIICDCDTKWIVDDNLSSYINNVNCADKNGKSIYTLNSKDFGNCL